MQFAAHIAVVVRTARTARYWSQARLAAEAGVHRGTVSRLEAGTSWVDLYAIARIASALDLNLTLGDR